MYVKSVEFKTKKPLQVDDWIFVCSGVLSSLHCSDDFLW